MRTSPVLAVAILIAVVTALIIIVDPAFAQYTRPIPVYRGAPGPMAGAGLITIAIGAGAYWLFRHFRKTG